MDLNNNNVNDLQDLDTFMGGLTYPLTSTALKAMDWTKVKVTDPVRAKISSMGEKTYKSMEELKNDLSQTL